MLMNSEPDNMISNQFLIEQMVTPLAKKQSTFLALGINENRNDARNVFLCIIISFICYVCTFIWYLLRLRIIQCFICVGCLKPKLPKCASEIELETGAALTCEERKRSSGNPILHMWL